MRLFFGLSLPEEIRAAAAACAQSAAASVPGRYALPENYHITLAFIGEVPPEHLTTAVRVLKDCISRFPAPRLALSGAGHFGRAQNGILILHADAEPALDPLHGALCSALAACGLPADPGPFSPHITLARHADVTRGLPPSPPQLSFTAECAHLYLSARDEQGVLRYTPLASARFAPPASDQ